jgi:hypothetical protein
VGRAWIPLVPGLPEGVRVAPGPGPGAGSSWCWFLLDLGPVVAPEIFLFNYSQDQNQGESEDFHLIIDFQKK